MLFYVLESLDCSAGLGGGIPISPARFVLRDYFSNSTGRKCHGYGLPRRDYRVYFCLFSDEVTFSQG